MQCFQIVSARSAKGLGFFRKLYIAQFLKYKFFKKENYKGVPFTLNGVLL